MAPTSTVNRSASTAEPWRSQPAPPPKNGPRRPGSSCSDRLRKRSATARSAQRAAGERRGVAGAEPRPGPPQGRLSATWSGWNQLAGRPGAALEREHRPHDLAGLHGAEGLVHVFEGHAARDHALEVELARLPEAQEPREVDADVGAAVHRALEHLLAVEELEGAERHHLRDAADADDHGGAAAAREVVALPGRRRVPDALERVVEALAPRDLLLRPLDVLGEAGVGGAELLRHRELPVDAVDREDLGGARDARALDRG